IADAAFQEVVCNGLELFFFHFLYIEEIDHNVSLFHFFQAPAYPDAFNEVARMLPDAGSIYQAELNAADINYFFYRVAGSSGYVAYDGSFLIQKGVEQGGLAGIGSAYYSYLNAVLYYIAQLKGIKQPAGCCEG